MTAKRRTNFVQPYRYPSPNVPLSAIRRFARQIAERFKPEKIILFGSYAYGKPHSESDVDLLVIMPTRNVIDQEIRIDRAFEPPFSLDLHVRTPYHIRTRLKKGDCDWFLYEVMTRGKVLYDASDTQPARLTTLIISTSITSPSPSVPRGTPAGGRSLPP